MTLNTDRFFRKLSLTTLIAVYFLILVGGIVRSTGSGMGCPDWPKCFGSLVPPTSADQLPENYKDIYSQKRAEKNERLSAYLSAMGMKSLADRISNDESILEEGDFNATKTWIEYINRLIGAVIGLLVFAGFITSMGLKTKRRRLLVVSILVLILTGFQGWIGSIVVSTNLLPGMVTFHMILALLIVLFLIYQYFQSGDVTPVRITGSRAYRPLLTIAIILMIVQVALGTQVREAVDVLAASVMPRSEWIANLGLGFKVHRSFSLIILAAHIYLIWKLRKNADRENRIHRMAMIIAAVVLVTIASGAVLAYFSLPAFIQPLHLLLGTGIVGLQYYLLLDLSAQTSGSHSDVKLANAI